MSDRYEDAISAASSGSLNRDNLIGTSDTGDHENQNGLATSTESANRVFKTNRPKAIIYANIFSLAMFIYNTLMKIAINENGINPLDLSLIRSLVTGVCVVLIARKTQQSFYIEKEDRPTMWIGAISGFVAFTCITYGVSMIPLVV